MGGRAFVDTNVLVYLFDRSEPAKQAVASRVWAEEAPGRNLVLSTQVLQEFYSVVTREGESTLSSEAAERVVLRLSEGPVVVLEPAMVLSAIRRARRARISFWDALIVEAALAGGCARLLTEDMQHGRDFDGLRVENPFRP